MDATVSGMTWLAGLWVPVRRSSNHVHVAWAPAILGGLGGHHLLFQVCTPGVTFSARSVCRPLTYHFSFAVARASTLSRTLPTRVVFSCDRAAFIFARSMDVGPVRSFEPEGKATLLTQ